MSGNDCCFDIRFVDSRCEFRLRLDMYAAAYRRKSSDAPMMKMCDFAAAAVGTYGQRLLVIELKEGAASWDAVRQLQKGLDLLDKHLPTSETATRPNAYLVVGKQAAQMKHRLRSKSKHLSFGKCRVFPAVHECGDSLEI
ncbi:MAG: hypothetical protein OXI83_11950 [Gemmatimonadota bacterium]|nr:hypothetical protein [Gemmatimonadota bacterium]